MLGWIIAFIIIIYCWMKIVAYKCVKIDTEINVLLSIKNAIMACDAPVPTEEIQKLNGKINKLHRKKIMWIMLGGH